MGHPVWLCEGLQWKIVQVCSKEMVSFFFFKTFTKTFTKLRLILLFLASSWQLEEQLYPVSNKLSAVFDSLAYWDIYSQYKHQCSAYFLNHQDTIAIAQYSSTRQKLVKYHSVIGGFHRRSSSHQCNFQMLDAWNQTGARPDSVC